MSTVVKRNTRIPTKQTNLYTTCSDNQTSALIKVYEGERAMTSENNLLGEFMLKDLPRVPRGEAKLKGTFEIDENGILHVSVVEPSTKKQNSITITNYRGRLSEEEVERMLEEAKKFNQEDEKERNRMSAMNSLVDYIYSIKKKMENDEIKNKTSVEYQHSVLAMCEETVKWTDTEKQATQEDYEQMRKKFENVDSLIMARKRLGSLTRLHE
ncbi:Heat shock cognate 70 kDa protein [Taenia solium]|eukprot:TsM_000197500 transcript=TsM_000197500 gene=TsM_000197500